jgi:signal transduction histidine kinase
MDVEGQRFGVLAIAWERAHELGPDRREFVESIARIGAAAFERARLLDAERRARQRAEDVRRHLDLLAEAGRVLGLSLEYEDTLRRVTGLAVPLLGDVGIVDVIEADGVRRLTATADPELSAAANLLETFPLDLAAGGPVAQVLEEGRARVFEIDDPLVESVARTADHAVALGTIGARWLLTIPLVAQGRTIGALTFLRRDERPYDFETIATAEELGDRAGRALENARLHRQVARLAEREQRHAGELEAVVGAIGEGILVSDPGGEVRSSNASATRILGGAVTSMDDVLDRLLDASGGRPAALAPGPVEYRLANRPTSWVEMATYVVPAADGLDAPSSVIVCRDVTAFRQGQALREAFLGLLSHELRTPVTTIYGGSSVLTRPGARIARQTQADILEDIAGEADRLYRLVEDLMVLARFDEGIELGSDPILLQHLVPAVAEQEAVRWPALRVVSDVQPDLPMVRGDETSVTQVVRNLLSNAAKYSEAGSEIRVVVASVPEGVAVRVLDRGPGIDPDEVEHLFDPFYRSPATAKMAGGAGIGLYVSRRLVDAMGGRIEAAPRPDGGSEFSVVLPLYGFDGDDA